MIAIIDYGIGNLGSVKNAFINLHFDAIVTSKEEEILAADKIVLPGVGAFEDAINALKKLNLDKVVFQCIKMKKPILGICVGMQMLFEYSYEYGKHKGLGIFKGNIIKFDECMDKIPHIGWNNIHIQSPSKLLNGLEDSYVYFVHSYHVDASCYTIATTNYAGVEFPSVVAKDSIYATQFHPEKSGEIGLKILKNFGDL